MPDKLTDAEIVKALEEMVDYPHNYEEGQELKNVLDLINRLQAENERLKDILDKKVIEFADDKKQKIKAEAYKEFAERLKGHRNGNYIFISTELLDNLLKEMVGEDK